MFFKKCVQLFFSPVLIKTALQWKTNFFSLHSDMLTAVDPMLLGCLDKSVFRQMRECEPMETNDGEFHPKLVRMCMCAHVCKCVFLRIYAPLLGVQSSSILCCCRVIFYTRQKKAVEGGNELFSLTPSRIPPSASLLYPVPSLPSTSILSALSPTLFCSLSPSVYVQGTICDCEIRPYAVTFRLVLFKANCILIICFLVICLYFSKKKKKKVFLSPFFFGSPFSSDLGLPSRG